VRYLRRVVDRYAYVARFDVMGGIRASLRLLPCNP